MNQEESDQYEHRAMICTPQRRSNARMETVSRNHRWLSVSNRPMRMRSDKFSGLGLTFDDVLLIPAGCIAAFAKRSPRKPESPATSRGGSDSLRRDGHRYRGRLAIALAREGGLGIIHRNLSIEDQVAEVDKVKRRESGMIVEPVTLTAERPVSRCPGRDGALPHLRRSDHRRGGQLVGILTNRDLRFIDDVDQPIGDVMTTKG